MSTAVLEQPGADELRFDVPLYTQVDASRALAMRPSTCARRACCCSESGWR